MDATIRNTNSLAGKLTDSAPALIQRRPEAGCSLGHYRIEEICGEGGMGSVYRAWDCALERPAAVKLLHSGAGWSVNPAMRREAHALSRLQHPNIATFFEVGEIHGQPYLALEFVDGLSLATRLRAGPLDALALQRLATGLLWALAHAHAAGVLHCDIKPANILLREDGDAVLLDFGIAKLLKADTVPADTAMDATDVVSGSPGYMAPEQLVGAPLSERSDLYAVALVLLEAHTGEPGCTGRDARERAQATLRGEPRQRAEQLDTPLRALLGRALSNDPALRPESAAAMQFELQQLWQHTDDDRGPRRMLALEPDCAELDLGLRWIGTAVVQAIRTALTAQFNLELAGPHAIAAARIGSSTADSLRLGQKLGCHWVLDGRIAGDTAALHVQLNLTDARNGQSVSRFETVCAFEEIFALHARLLDWLSAQLLDFPAVAPRPAFDGSEAELCARGELAFRKGGKDGMTESEACYRAVLAHKPDSLLALSGLAGVLPLRYTFTTNPALLGEAEVLARAAIRLDANAFEARTWLAYVLLRQGRHRAGIAQAARAAKGNPDGSMAFYFGACCHAALSRWKPALALYQASVRTDRTRCFSWIGAAWCHQRLGHFEEALFCIRTAERLESEDGPLRTAGCGAFLGEMLRQRGELEIAWRETHSALQRVEHSDFFYRDSFRAFALLTLGRIALDRADELAAQTAFNQACAALEARPSMLGGGHLMVQALAGSSRAAHAPQNLERARVLYAERPAPWSFEWTWGSSNAETENALALARGEGGQ